MLDKAALSHTGQETACRVGTKPGAAKKGEEEAERGLCMETERLVINPRNAQRGQSKRKPFAALSLALSPLVCSVPLQH